jgi:hypothetical protein
MARDITKPTVPIGADSTTLLFTIVNGEQQRKRVRIGWIPDLTGYSIHARIIEAANDGSGVPPTKVQPNGKRMLLNTGSGHIRNIVLNEFDLVLPWDICHGFDKMPEPDAAVYAFFELEVGEPGTGDASPVGDAAPVDKQVWKPLRGMIRVEFSPTEFVEGEES